MDAPVRIPLPLPHIGSVNAWLLPGDPLTLIDTGPCDDEALPRSRPACARAGVRLEDLELVLVTHHHLDHSGLAAHDRRAARARGSPPTSARPPTARDYDERGEADRRFSLALMRHHGVPDDGDRRHRGVLGVPPPRSRTPTTPTSCSRTASGSAPAAATCASSPAPATARPTRCSSTSASAIAFVGDHLLAKISSNTEIYPALEPTGTRPRARVEYLESLRQTAAMPLVAPAHRARRRHHRSRRARRAAAGRPRAPLRADRRRARRRRDHRVRDRRRPVAREDRSSSSLCWSSGRCSGTSTCCSTPDASSEQVTEDGSTYGVASFALAGNPLGGGRSAASQPRP